VKHQAFPSGPNDLIQFVFELLAILDTELGDGHELRPFGRGDEILDALGACREGTRRIGQFEDQVLDLPPLGVLGQELADEARKLLEAAPAQP